MKLMKRIAAIMLSVVMVLGMSSVVSATTTTGPVTSASAGSTVKGKITIDNAIVGQTYKIYKILELESYDTAGTGSYAYKVAAGSGWEGFVTGTGNAYLEKDASGYVTWKAGVTADDATKAAFAKKALEYAKTASPAISATEVAATTTTVEFDNLELGYYLVDSSAGALCSLTTTANEITIQEKNGAPTVEKKVKEDSITVSTTTDGYQETNTADIGQTVEFKTTITAKAGAENYVLHDTMSAGLTFDANSVAVKWTDASGIDKGTVTKGEAADPKDYIVATPGAETTGSKCTFEIKFSQTFCDRLVADDKLIVTYSATLNENASIGTTGNKNKTKLTYGDNKETTESTTTTKTYEIPVFKYTNKTGTEEGLAGATFVLSKESNSASLSGNEIKLVKLTPSTSGDDVYRVAKTGDTATVTEITTPATGKFTIQGLDADTYYLHETKQPDGYNKLTAPVTIMVEEDGTFTPVATSTGTNRVEIENKTGSLLPSTGGRGTTILYVLGALLVLGSSVVLITKRRMKE